jgi:hypothetical protein
LLEENCPLWRNQPGQYSDRSSERLIQSRIQAGQPERHCIDDKRRFALWANKCLADSRYECTRLVDRPAGIGERYWLARIVDKAAKPLHLVQRAAELRCDQVFFNEPKAECRNEAAVFLRGRFKRRLSARPTSTPMSKAGKRTTQSVPAKPLSCARAVGLEISYRHHTLTECTSTNADAERRRDEPTVRKLIAPWCKSCATRPLFAIADMTGDAPLAGAAAVALAPAGALNAPAAAIARNVSTTFARALGSLSTSNACRAWPGVRTTGAFEAAAGADAGVAAEALEKTKEANNATITNLRIVTEESPRKDGVKKAARCERTSRFITKR